MCRLPRRPRWSADSPAGLPARHLRRPAAGHGGVLLHRRCLAPLPSSSTAPHHHRPPPPRRPTGAALAKAGQSGGGGEGEGGAALLQLCPAETAIKSGNPRRSG
jgi:hypothetical protein